MTTVKGPLTGVKVVDLSRVLAGPYCTLWLAELGAEVVKVETPHGGDDSRTFMPFIEGVSAYFMSINRGKKSVALDLKKPEDRAQFEGLLAGADVLVENFRPGVLDRLGYGYEAIKPRFPRLIYAAISGFGHSGPYAARPAYDMIVQAMSGIMSITGYPGEAPARVGVSIGDLAAGLFALGGINAALYHRERTGEGQKLDIAMLDCQIALLENAVAQLAATGRAPGPLGARHGSIAPFGIFLARDGFLALACGNDALFGTLCDTIGAPELKSDLRFAANKARVHHVNELTTVLDAVLQRHDRAYWFAALEAAGVPCGPINTVADLLTDPQVKARHMLVTAHDPKAGAVLMPGNPIKSSLFPDSDRREAAPSLGQDQALLQGG